MGSIKANYGIELVVWLRWNVMVKYNKYTFIEVFAEAYPKTATVANAVAGFQKAGIYPWAPEKINTSKLFASKLFDPRHPKNMPLPPYTRYEL